MKSKRLATSYVACTLSIVNMSAVTNLIAVLFVSFSKLYGFGVWQLGLLVGINFFAQLFADIVLTLIIDKVPHRVLAASAVMLSAVGFCLLGTIPFCLPSSALFSGIVAATVVFAFSGGMLEVIITPIIDALPSGGDKGREVSLMHSFYAWGQVLVVAATALFILFAGAEKWPIVVFVWAVIPLAAFVLFLFCPVYQRKEESKKEKTKTLFSPYLLVCLAAILLGGASEIISNQYISTFAHMSLGFSEAVSDLVGMCLFAAMLGSGRVLYALLGDKLGLGKFLTITAFLTFVLFVTVGLVDIPVVALIACVLAGFTTSLLWPGTLVVAAKKFLNAGAWIYAMLAVFGDVGAAVFPMAFGFTADAVSGGIKTTFLIFSVIPFLCFLCQLYLYKKRDGLPGKMTEHNEGKVDTDEKLS